MFRLITAVVLLLAVIALPACGPGRTHEKHVNAADDRWRAVRSGMFLQMAQQRFDTGDLDEAEGQLVEALTVDPKNPELFILSGRIALERGQLERSYNRFSQAIELGPDRARAYYYRGLVEQRWMKYQAAFGSYEKALELEPDKVTYLMAMSEMLVSTDKSDDALELLKSKTVYFDQNAAIRIAIGRLLAMKGEIEESIPYFKEGAMLNPDDMQAQEELAAAYMRAGEFELASERLKLLLLDPEMSGRSDIASSLAECYMKMGQLDKARTAYRDLLRKDPDLADGWIKLGQVLWILKDLSGANEAANRAIASAPQRFEGYLLSGMVWQKRNSVHRALSMFDKAAKLAPEVAMPMILRGLTLEQAGRREAAAAAYTEALRREPEDARIQQLLSSVNASQ